MTESYRQTEERIVEAVAAAQARPNEKVTRLAEEYDVPISRLRCRLQGRQSKMDRVGTNRVLDELQELALCNYMDRLETIGTCPQQSDIRGCANNLLKQAHPDGVLPPPTVGTTWVTRFLGRHPEYKVQKQRCREMKRKKSHDSSKIRRWFEQYRDLRNELGIPDCDVWNMDETGFTVGRGCDQRIYVKDTSRRKELGTETDESHVTIIKAVSGSGQTIPPISICPGKVVMSEWIASDMTNDYGFLMNDSGYCQDEDFMIWIKHFNRLTEHTQVSNYRLLLLDGYGSHCTYEFIQFCDSHQIKPFCLPPNASHFMQPLDVAVFSPYKHWHCEAIEEAAWSGCENYDKYEFFNNLASIRRKTLIETTIREGFQATGLIPYNPDLVLAQLLEHEEDECQAARPVTPEMHPDDLIPTTPMTVRRLRLQAQQIEMFILPQLDPEPAERLQKFLTGAQFQAVVGTHASEALLTTRAAEVARTNRRSKRSRRLPSGGLMLASEGREMVRRRDEDEEGVLRRKLENIEKKKQAKAARELKAQEVAARKLVRLEKARQRAEQLEARRIARQSK